MKIEEKIAGILGGMGPEATIDLMRRILRLTPAMDDADHIHCIIDDNAKVPSRIKAIIEKTGESAGPVLAAMARRLEAAGADFLAMPCNTAHYYYPEIQSAVNIPVLNIIALTVEAAIKAGRKSAGCVVGVLASPSIRITGLYDEQVKNFNASTLYPDAPAQAALFNLIKRVKSGNYDHAACGALNDFAAMLAAGGADVAVIACTELSVINTQTKADIPVVDAAEVLAQAIIQEAKGR